MHHRADVQRPFGGQQPQLRPVGAGFARARHRHAQVVVVGHLPPSGLIHHPIDADGGIGIGRGRHADVVARHSIEDFDELLPAELDSASSAGAKPSECAEPNAPRTAVVYQHVGIRRKRHYIITQDKPL